MLLYHKAPLYLTAVFQLGAEPGIKSRRRGTIHIFVSYPLFVGANNVVIKPKGC